MGTYVVRPKCSISWCHLPHLRHIPLMFKLSRADQADFLMQNSGFYHRKNTTAKQRANTCALTCCGCTVTCSAARVWRRTRVATRSPAVILRPFGSDSRYMPYGEVRSGFTGSVLPTDRRFIRQRCACAGRAAGAQPFIAAGKTVFVPMTIWGAVDIVIDNRTWRLSSCQR